MNSKNKCKYIIGTLTTVLCLTACGHTNEEKELADFSSSISSFTASIQDANQQINELDVNDANASQELLSILDGLDEKFKELADLSVPEQYQSIETLADEASKNMTNAVSYFHSAYEGEAFDEQDADVAYQYYTRAMVRIEYIGYVLVGEIPENDHVTVQEQELNDTRFIDKILDNNDEKQSTSEMTTTISVE
ncbi:MAG: hypothetical protein MR392_05075 [Roseburia sp.]|nr:hypothetical protein [Roseburia sp.]